MRTFIVILLLRLLSSSVAGQDYGPQVSEMAAAMTQSMTSAGKKSVAVLELTDRTGRAACFGQLIAEELSIGLVVGGRGFEVVSRNDGKLKAVLAEQKLGTTGIIDPQSAARIGQIVGVQALIAGTVNIIGDNLRVTLTLIDSTTARIVGGTGATIPRTRAIEEYMTRCESGPPDQPVAAAPVSGPVSNQRPQARTLRSVTVELAGCVRSGASVSCELTFINGDRDRNVDLLPAKAFDSGGLASESARVTLAGMTGAQIRARLINGTRTQSSVVFENIAASATRLSALYVIAYCRDPGTNLHQGAAEQFEFRNVPIGASR